MGLHPRLSDAAASRLELVAVGDGLGLWYDWKLGIGRTAMAEIILSEPVARVLHDLSILARGGTRNGSDLREYVL